MAGLSRSRTTLAVPPGYTVREQLECRKMTQKEFELRMDMSEKHISRLINGEVHLTPDVASRIEAILGISAQYWNNLETRYREKLHQVEDENAMDADKELLPKIPYGEMARLGWVDNTKKATDKVRNLRRFFEVARLGVLERISMPNVVYRMQSGAKKKDYILAVWVQKARLMARNIEVSPVNLARLEAIVPELRKLTYEQPEEFVPKLSAMLGKCGIALVLLPHLKGSFLYGASFYDCKKIVMALTLRGRDADKFWFSVFHEIGHILKGHISRPFGASDDDEKEADEYARDTLIPPDKYREFVSAGNYTYSRVREFALDMGIDAGIVVGRLQKDGEIGFDELNGLKCQYDIADMFSKCEEDYTEEDKAWDSIAEPASASEILAALEEI